MTRVVYPLLALAIPTVLFGCKKDGDLKITQSVSETFTQVPTNEVDILWVVDDSVSMVEEQERVINGASDFIDHLDESGMDFHIGVITTGVDDEMAGVLRGDPTYLTNETPDYTELFKERAQVGTDGAQMESGLEAAILAVTAPNVEGANTGFLRPDAKLAVIVLSDENDCSDFGALPEGSDNFDCYADGAPLTPVDTLVEMLRNAKGIDEHSSTLSLSGIIGPPFEEGCADATPGDRYSDAIEEIGGLNANICSADYSSIMSDLGLLAASPKSVFNLANEAADGSIVVTVTAEDGSSWEVPEDATNGWVYTTGEGLSRLSFYGDGVPPRGSEFTVDYTVYVDTEDPAGVYE